MTLYVPIDFVLEIEISSKIWQNIKLLQKASVVSSRHVADACSLYLLSFLLDSTVGLVIIYILLYCITYLSKLYNVWYTLPGQYDDGSDVASGDIKRMLFPWSIQTFLFLVFSGTLGFLRCKQKSKTSFNIPKYFEFSDKF